MLKSKRIRITFLFIVITLGFYLVFSSCSTGNAPTSPTPQPTPVLTSDDVQRLLTQAVDQAQRLNQQVVVAVTDRVGNILAIYSMTNTQGSTWDVNVGAVPKARTAAYLSSNQHGFTTLTACFITRSHFPPGIANTPGGPLYGVPFSSLGGGDMQPNNSAPPGQIGNGQQGLTGVPGGVPVFKNGLLAGGLGVSSFGTVGRLPASFLIDCGSGIPIADEAIALGAVIGYSVPGDRRADTIFIDGVQLPYQIAQTPPSNFTLNFSDLSNLGTLDPTFPLLNPVALPDQGPVDLGDGLHNYNVIAGQVLAAADVQLIIDQAVAKANQTRAAIRRPFNSSARVFISVADVDGTILGVWRTPDATLFSYDVSGQKARTVVAFSDPNNLFGAQIRQVLGMPVDQPLAVTTRAAGFLSQRFFPPGIDQPTNGTFPQPGPLFIPDPILPLNDYRWQQNIALAPFGNGITIFPGGIPLYKNGQLAGGIGVSGDGVDQDDYIAAAGAAGFEPTPQIRSDQFFYLNVRLPYVKFPRNPDL
ncbi:MAG TPA: heme-binding protein [bacterium]